MWQLKIQIWRKQLESYFLLLILKYKEPSFSLEGAESHPIINLPSIKIFMTESRMLNNGQ